MEIKGVVEMKYITAFIFCLFLVVLLFGIDLETRYKDYEAKIEIVVYNQNEKIKELEKEIRLLKTDMEILENGYER